MESRKIVLMKLSEGKQWRHLMLTLSLLLAFVSLLYPLLVCFTVSPPPQLPYSHQICFPINTI